MVVPLEAPRVVQGHRDLPRQGGTIRHHLIVAERVEVAQAVPDAAVDERLRLERTHVFAQLERLLPRQAERTVEPDVEYLPVIRQEFPELRVDLVAKVARDVFP